MEDKEFYRRQRRASRKLAPARRETQMNAGERNFVRGMTVKGMNAQKNIPDYSSDNHSFDNSDSMNFNSQPRSLFEQLLRE
jgi:hypothetical protein